MSQLFTSGGQSIGASASASVLPMNSGLISFRMDWLDLLAVQGAPESSSTAQFKSINSSALSIVYGPALTSIHDYWKNHSFDYMDLCWQISLLFNMLFVITFLPRSKHLLISWQQSLSSVILEPRRKKSVTVSIFSPSIYHEVMGLDAMILDFQMLNFKPV